MEDVTVDFFLETTGSLARLLENFQPLLVPVGSSAGKNVTGFHHHLKMSMRLHQISSCAHYPLSNQKGSDLHQHQGALASSTIYIDAGGIKLRWWETPLPHSELANGHWDQCPPPVQTNFTDVMHIQHSEEKFNSLSSCYIDRSSFDFVSHGIFIFFFYTLLRSVMTLTIQPVPAISVNFSCQLSKTAELLSPVRLIPLYKYFMSQSCSDWSKD